MAKISTSKMSVEQAGLTLGIVLALFHFVWVLIVASGNGQAVVDWYQRMHFVSKDVAVAPFDPATALTLILATFIVGAIIGAVFALVWNWTGKHKF